MKKTLIAVLLIAVLVFTAACGTTAPQVTQKDWDLSVVNSEGAGVEGVQLQICSDKVCMMVTTDANGTADFNGDEASYEVHVMSCPEKYSFSEDAVTMTKGEKCQITLAAAEAAEVTETAATAGEPTATVTKEADGRMKVTFSSVDMQGNTVDDSIFAQNKVTMINLWEPWCSPCKEEMPWLENLYQEYKDQGFMIIGLHGDNEDLESVVADAGVTYPIVDRGEDGFMDVLNETQGFPTSFFVDSEGYIIVPSGDVFDQQVKDMVEGTKESIKATLEAYQNGEFDEYKDDEDYADYFAQFDAMIADSSLIDEEAQAETEEALGVGTGYYVGSRDYDSWKQIIEFQFSMIG